MPVRWIPARVPFYATSDQRMVDAVYVEEPDAYDSVASASASPSSPSSARGGGGGGGDGGGGGRRRGGRERRRA